MELEHLMRSFPNFLSKYVEDNNIHLTKTEELRIYECFQDNTMNDSANHFCEFAMRNGDKSLLLNLAQLSAKKHTFNEKNVNTDMDYYNPNAELVTIQTMVGSFYGSDQSAIAINGMQFKVIGI